MSHIDWPEWPQYGPDAAAAVDRVIRSNQLFASAEVRHFEEAFASYLGARFALGVGNATQGLHLALAALGVGEGDEVIVTPYSWISSASCILMQNAVPVFCDIEDDSLGIDPDALNACITERTRAIIMVHMFGYPAKAREVAAVAKASGLALIEDASHAHGAEVQGQKIGTFGSLSVFSLHQRKSLSVGDGGLVCTSSDDLAERVYRLRSFGDDELSYNYRMTEFAGALGALQLAKLDKENEIRAMNAHNLADLMRGATRLRVRLERPGEKSVFYAALLDVNGSIREIDQKVEALQLQGIPIRKTWAPLHRHPHFNPTQVPARGLPWLHPAYKGTIGQTPYAETHLPRADALCPDRILELYVHPPAGRAEIEFAAECLLDTFGD